MSTSITLKHWCGGTKVIRAGDWNISDNGKRVHVHFAHAHVIEFLLETGLEVGKRKGDALDDGKGRLSTWHIDKADLKRLRGTP